MNVVCVHCETSLGGAPSVIYAVFLDPYGAWIHGPTWLDKFCCMLSHGQPGRAKRWAEDQEAFQYPGLPIKSSMTTMQGTCPGPLTDHPREAARFPGKSIRSII
jgi:hypothetical protein